MTEQILKWLWQVSLQASVLIIALWLIRLLFARKISARLRYALWALVLVRLFIPIAVSSPVSIMNGARPVTQTMERIFIVQDAASQDQMPANTDQYDTPVDQTKTTDAIMPSTAPFPTAAILLTVWIAGAAVVFLLTTISNVRFHLRCKQVRRQVDVDDILQPLTRQSGLKRLPVVYECSAVASACVVGFVNPCIYLPKAQFTEMQYRHILLHELCHIKRHDNYWSVMRGVCCILYWFNPFIWLAGYYSHRDCELACDERVLARLDNSERRAYGMTLISQLQKGAPALPSMQVTATLAMGKKEMKERIIMIAGRGKTALGAAILALLLVTSAVAVACTNASPVAGNKTANEPVSTNTPNKPASGSQTPSASAAEFALLPDTMNYELKAEGRNESVILKKFVFNDLLAFYLDADGFEYAPATIEANCGAAVLKEKYQLGGDTASPEISVSFRRDGNVRKWVQTTQEIADPGKYTEVTLGGYPCTKMVDAVYQVNYEIYALDYLDGYLLIQLKYFDEYADGWAARMRQMLDTITLNEGMDAGRIVLLLSEPDRGKVSVEVVFTEDALHTKYYVPEEEVQAELIPLLLDMKTQELTPGWWKDQKRLGYSVLYNDKRWDVWSGGILASREDSVRATDPEIAERIQKLVQEKLGITPFDPGRIKGITSARFDVQFYGKGKRYTQTVTDPQALAAMEALLSDTAAADSGCPFAEGYLTLTLKSGETIRLAMGTDSCTTYFVNGMTFDYRPADVRGKEDSGVDNSILFRYFDQIPMKTRGG